MERLLSPDFGLMFWTLLIFIATVAILAKTAWKPLIGALDERENRLKAERTAAEEARQAAERLKAELDGQLAQIQQRAQEAIAQAMQQGQKSRDKLVHEAQEEAKSLVEKARRQLEDEKERLVRELRTQVADLSVQAAERLIKKSVDAGVQKKVLDEFLAGLESKKGLS